MSFPVSQLFTSGGQIIGVSASASVLPMNIPDCFPLGWTGSSFYALDISPLLYMGFVNIFSHSVVGLFIPFRGSFSEIVCSFDKVQFISFSVYVLCFAVKSKNSLF